MTPEPPMSFEDAVANLEEIVTALETGNLPLHECLRHFEEAVALSRHCASQLEAAERQINILTEEEGLAPASEVVWTYEEVTTARWSEAESEDET
jgi:exodeoxyribonuclease VII small subunit